MAGEQVLEGREHRYTLGPEIGRRVFRGRNEAGDPVAVKIAAKEVLLGHASLVRYLPEGLLPRVIEFSELSGGRLGFLVTEYVSGYSLGDLLSEGRRLSRYEAKRLAENLARSLTTFTKGGIALLTLSAKDVVWETSTRKWRIVSPGAWARTPGERSMARLLAQLVHESSDVGRGGDGRFEQALRRAQAGDITLSDLRRCSASRLSGGPLWHRLASFWTAL